MISGSYDMFNRYPALIGCAFLAACGGGAGSLPDAPTGPEVNAIAKDQTLGVERVKLPSSQTYATLFQDTGTGQVIIEGVGAYTTANAPSGAPEYGEYVYGLRDLSNGNIAITDTKVVLVDNDGLTTVGGASYYGSSLAGQYLGTGKRTAIDQSGYDYVRIGSARLGDNSEFDLVFGVSRRTDRTNRAPNRITETLVPAGAGVFPGAGRFAKPALCRAGRAG